MNFKFIYKICTKSELNDAKDKQKFEGSKKDLDDGFIHFSGEEQVKETLKKYYSILELRTALTAGLSAFSGGAFGFYLTGKMNITLFLLISLLLQTQIRNLFSQLMEQKQSLQR